MIVVECRKDKSNKIEEEKVPREYITRLSEVAMPDLENNITEFPKKGKP